MKIVNGKWKAENDEAVDNFNIKELLDIGEKVKAVYGEDITYDRINLISSIRTLTREQENAMVSVLNQEGLLNRLSGY
jgi:hypothetical protein